MVHIHLTVCQPYKTSRIHICFSADRNSEQSRRCQREHSTLTDLGIQQISGINELYKGSVWLHITK